MPQQKAEMMCRFYHCYNVFARIRAVKCRAFPALLDCFPRRSACFYFHISLHYDERVCAYRRMSLPRCKTTCCNLIIIRRVHAASHPDKAHTRAHTQASAQAPVEGLKAWPTSVPVIICRRRLAGARSKPI